MTMANIGAGLKYYFTENFFAKDVYKRQEQAFDLAYLEFALGEAGVATVGLAFVADQMCIRDR